MEWENYLQAFDMEEKISTKQVGTPGHVALGHAQMAWCKSIASEIS